MNIAQATISNEYKLEHTLQSISIKFVKETYLDDVLTCKTYKTDEQDACVHIIEKGDETVCQISTKWKLKNRENIFKSWYIILFLLLIIIFRSSASYKCDIVII